MMKRTRCVAKGCVYDREGIHKSSKAWRILHQFPDDTTQCLAWMRLSGNTNILKKSLKTIRDKLSLCSAHFERKDYKSTRILGGAALPTMFPHSEPIPIELMKEYAAQHNVEKYLNSFDGEIVAPIPATSDHNYYISDVTDFGRDLGDEESASTSKPASSVEDSIIFVQANNGSNPGNPDEASTLREELQTMESHEVSNWLQLSEDVDCAEIVMNEEDPTASKWKHCKKYQRKKVNPNFQLNPYEKHLELMKMKKSITVNPSYITLQNESAAAESCDPMSRLVNVDKSRSLMTQEYVSSVLSALDTDLSYSVFDQEKNSKAANAPVARPLSPRQREPDSPAPTVNRKTSSKASKAVVVVPSPTINQTTTPGSVFPTPGPPASLARFQLVGHRLTSPPPLVPFQHSADVRLKGPVFTIQGLRFPGASVTGLRLEKPATAITGLRIGTSGSCIPALRVADGVVATPTPQLRAEKPVAVQPGAAQPGVGLRVQQSGTVGTGPSLLRINNPRTVAASEMPQADAEDVAAEDASAEDAPAEDMEVDDYSDERWPRLPKNLCRVCAKACAKLEYVFSAKGIALNLAELVHTHLPIMVTPEDLLPTHICTSCITRLQAADSLVRTCMEADTNLKGLLELAKTQIRMGGIFDDGDHFREDDAPSQENAPKIGKWKGGKGTEFSNLLSEEDVSLINKMKGDGLKVTLVRVPNLNDLPEEKKHQRVLQVLRSMSASKSAAKNVKKRPLASLIRAQPDKGNVGHKGQHDPTNRETANISPVDSALQDLTAGSALRDPETANITLPEQPPREKETSTPEPVEEVPVVDLSAEAIRPSESPKTQTQSALAAAADPNISIAPHVPSLLRNELLDGISYAIKQGHVAKTGSIIKLNCKPGDASTSPASVYVYVRNKDTPPNPHQLPRKILDLDILHEHQQRQNKLKEKRAAAKVAKHQASIMKRKARVREKRRVIKERKSLTCDECGTVFDSKEEVAEHRMEHLKCQFCGKQFSKKPSLVEHERVHTKEKPFICEQCGRAFRTRAQMTQHAQRHNTNTPYRCQFCGQEFAVRNTYQAHVNRHSTDAPYLCEVCGKCFKVQVALRLHRLTHRSFNCNICDKVFSYRAYQIHKKSHAGDESKFPCTYCNKKFLTVHRLKIHMLIHEATYPFSCSVCKRSFKRMTHLQAHQNRHSADQLDGVAFFCCAICQLQFEQPSMLSQHLKSHTEEERQALRSYKCDTCNKSFSIERELRTHELRHAGKQTFSCGTCDKAFDTKKEFDEHSDTHTEDKPFACDVCGKRFRALINLNNHQQIHLTFKPYPCQSCPKAFKTINGLNQHKVVHSDVRKHTCSICSMGFKRRDAMKNHERTHFAERPYACSVCGRAFKVKADCSTHLKRHREAGIEGSIMESCYTCPVCSATFTLKVDLSTHVNNVHQLEVAVLDKDDNLVLVPEVEIF